MTKTYWRASTYHRRKRVSRAHAVMLAAYEREKNRVVSINQGRRTIAEQWAFVREKGVYNARTNPHGAAYPTPAAPHIKWSKANHAIDADDPHPVHDLASFYEHHGVPVAFNVAGEGWHMDVLDEAKLIAAAEKLSGPRTLKRGMHGKDVRRLKVQLVKRGFAKGKIRNDWFNPWTKRGVKKAQKKYGLKQDGIVGPKTRQKLGL